MRSRLVVLSHGLLPFEELDVVEPHDFDRDRDTAPALRGVVHDLLDLIDVLAQHIPLDADASQAMPEAVKVAEATTRIQEVGDTLGAEIVREGLVCASWLTSHTR